MALFFASLPAFAQSGNAIYMCVDEHGGRSITNVKSEMKGRKCERQIELAPLPTTGAKPPARAVGSPTPADFPKVDAGTQKARDDLRHKVLTEELANEQKLLDQANRDYTDAKKPRAGEEQSSSKYLERVNEAEKAVQRHRQNIESLQREIGSLK